MADAARQYLINRRMIASDRIVAIDGGFRETAEYDLFSLSAELPPPSPTPTVPSTRCNSLNLRRDLNALAKVAYKFDGGMR